MDLMKKLDLFTSINEEEVGTRPIQFMKFWNGFRPGDRCDVEMGEDYVSIVGTNANGSFAGVKKEFDLEDETDVQDFKSLERDVWDYC
jgi:hypothetical protein